MSRARLELATTALKGRCSTIELPAPARRERESCYQSNKRPWGIYSFGGGPPICWAMTNEERRRERRVRSRGPVSLVAEGCEPVSGTIFDVSISGISVDSEHAIGLGSPVRIDGQGFAGDGIVRYCGPHHGRFRIGIELVPAN